MRRTLSLLAAAGLIVGIATPAAAQFLNRPYVAGALTGKVVFADVGGLDVETADADGSLLFSIANPGVNIQLDASFENVFDAPAGIPESEAWSFSGEIFWRDAKGTFGVSVGTRADDAFDGSFDTASYSLFGEYYVNPMFTVQGKAGWFDTDTPRGGYFASAGATVYFLRNIAWSVGVDYRRIDNPETNVMTYSADVEFLPYPEIPASFFVGYAYTDFENLPESKAAIAGVRVYFGGGGSSGTLLDRHRSGPVRNANML